MKGLLIQALCTLYSNKLGRETDKKVERIWMGPLSKDVTSLAIHPIFILPIKNSCEILKLELWGLTWVLLTQHLPDFDDD